MKINKIVYWAATLLLSAMMLLSASMYLGKFAEMSAGFQALGYPPYLPLILAAAKILGAAAILARRFATLREWAYVGFAAVVVAFILLGTSYLFERRTRAA